MSTRVRAEGCSLNFSSQQSRPGWSLPRIALLVVLLIAHGLLLSRLFLNGEQPRGGAMRRVLTELRLIPPPQMRPAPLPKEAPKPPRTAIINPLPLIPAPITAPAEAAASPASPSTESAVTAPAAATPGGTRSTVAPLNLALPARSGSKLESIDINPAISDPRANTPRLRFSEKFAVAAGEYDCIVVKRGPEGGLERFPGEHKTVSSASGAWGSGGTVKVCVRKPGSAAIR